MKQFATILLVLPLLFSACFKKEAKKKTDKVDTNGQTYFSIRDFAKDQWKTYNGQPFGILKTVNVNGSVDTVYTNAMDMDLGYVLKVFVESDISSPEMLGKYRFSRFADASTSTINFYYEAKDKGLFTKKLHIMVDNVTMVVKSIYIETEKSTNLNTVTRKLFYQPVETISIQEYETSKVGDTKKMVVEYKFI